MTPAAPLIAALLLPSPAGATERERALDNATWFVTHTWTMTSENLTADCSSDYESQYSPGTWTGLPYDWGGYMFPDEFDEQIADGYGAGSHSWHGSLSCTAGVDCSGFLSKVWETGHYSTSTFDSVTHVISVADIERADGFNKASSHCVLFAYETAGGIPVLYESAGTPDKVRINADSGWGYLDGYDAVRFDDIEDGPSTGTASEPISITAFPYTDLRWTAGAASDELDSYSCAPSTDESGPEMLYRFEAATAGTLEVVVSDDSGVDIDVHVMTAPDGDACLARDDTAVSLEVGPGEIWLSLDTYVGGREYPGPYLMTATFTGTLGEAGADGGSTDGGTTDGGSSGSTDGGPTDGGSTDGGGGSTDGTDGGTTDGGPGNGGGPGDAQQPGAGYAAWQRTPLSAQGGCTPAPTPASGGLVAAALALAGLRRRTQKP